MTHEISVEDDVIDFKVTKKHHPSKNNNSVLEFNLPKDPNLFLQKNKIVIRGNFEIDENYVIENGFAAKLFSMLTVEVDSQCVSKNYNR